MEEHWSPGQTGCFFKEPFSFVPVQAMSHKGGGHKIKGVVLHPKTVYNISIAAVESSFHSMIQHLFGQIHPAHFVTKVCLGLHQSSCTAANVQYPSFFWNLKLVDMLTQNPGEAPALGAVKQVVYRRYGIENALVFF